MTILDTLYASGGPEVILPTLELSCDAWPALVVLVKDYVDHVITTEDDRQLTAIGCGMAVALPKRDASGAQHLTFAIDGVRTEAQRLLREANAAGAEVRVTFRAYAFPDLSAPAEAPAHMIMRKYAARANHIEITAGYFDLIDMKWPRDVFNDKFSPGLKYLQ